MPDLDLGNQGSHGDDSAKRREVSNDRIFASGALGCHKERPRRDKHLISAYWAGSNFFIVLNAGFGWGPVTEATKIRMSDLCRSD